MLLEFTYVNRKYHINGLDKTPTRMTVHLHAVNCHAAHRDVLNLYSHKARKNLIKELSLLFKEDTFVLEQEIEKIIKKIEDRENGIVPAINQTSDITEEQKTQAIEFARSPDLMQIILDDFANFYIGEEQNKLISYIAMTSRKMERPLNAAVISSSGAGKSALTDLILSFCPPDELIKLTSMTAKSLFYADSLAHKVLYISEEPGMKDVEYSIRTLISDQQLTIYQTTRDHQGKLVSKVNKVNGPVSVFKTSTRIRGDEETRSRFFQLWLNESPEQTRKILEFLNQTQSIEFHINKVRFYKIIEKHRNFQKILRPLQVMNPFAHKLTYSGNKVSERRKHSQYLQLIKAIGFLNQYQHSIRKSGNIEYIETTEKDIDLATQLISHIRYTDDLTTPAHKLLSTMQTIVEQKKIKQGAGRISITRRELRDNIGWSEKYVRDVIKELLDMDYIIQHRGGIGQTIVYEVINYSSNNTVYEPNPAESVEKLNNLVQPRSIPTTRVNSLKANKLTSTSYKIGSRERGGRI